MDLQNGIKKYFDDFMVIRQKPVASFYPPLDAPQETLDELSAQSDDLDSDYESLQSFIDNLLN